MSSFLWSHGLQHARPHYPPSLPKLMSIASVIPSSHLILWHRLLLLPSIFPSIRDFSSESAVHIRWPKYWNLSFSISPSKEYPRLISLKIDCFDLLAVQGTLRVFFSTTVQRYQFFSILPSLQFSFHNHTWPQERPSVQFNSVAQLCLTLCDPMDCIMPAFPVDDQLPELTQTHVHWVSDAIQSSHPLSSPSPPAFNLSQHQGLFNWVSSSHQVAKVLEFQLQHQCFQWICRADFP